MFWTIVFFLVGLALIIKGGDFFVDAASWMAKATEIPSFIIGATIVSLATTLPELLVSVFSSLQGSYEMAIGNAVGSVSCNTGFIMAISLIAMPGIVRRRDIVEKGILLLLSSALLWLFSAGGTLTKWGALVLYLVLIAFIYCNVQSVRNQEPENRPEKQQVTRRDIAVNLVKFILGTVGIVAGARLLVDNGTALARYAGVSEAVIGLTLVALGTSLPELVTTVTAIVKKEHSISVGNIVGANIIDLTLILSTCAMMSKEGLPVAAASLRVDIPAALVLCAVAVVPAMLTGKFRRWQGFVLLALYAAYLLLIML